MKGWFEPVVIQRVQTNLSCLADNNNFYIHFWKVFVLLFLCLLPESLGAGLAVNYDASGCVAYALSRDVVFRI